MHPSAVTLLFCRKGESASRDARTVNKPLCLRPGACIQLSSLWLFSRLCWTLTLVEAMPMTCSDAQLEARIRLVAVNALRL